MTDYPDGTLHGRGSVWITTHLRGWKSIPSAESHLCYRIPPLQPLSLSCTRRLGSKKVKLISGKLSDSRVMLAWLEMSDALWVLPCQVMVRAIGEPNISLFHFSAVTELISSHLPQITDKLLCSVRFKWRLSPLVKKSCSSEPGSSIVADPPVVKQVW